MSQHDVPPLVTVVERALGARVLSLRYLPSPSAAAAALATETPGSAQHTSEVAFDDLLTENRSADPTA